jgi:hypothetical protein
LFAEQAALIILALRMCMYLTASVLVWHAFEATLFDVDN